MAEEFPGDYDDSLQMAAEFIDAAEDAYARIAGVAISQRTFMANVIDALKMLTVVIEEQRFPVIAVPGYQAVPTDFDIPVVDDQGAIVPQSIDEVPIPEDLLVYHGVPDDEVQVVGHNITIDQAELDELVSQGDPAVVEFPQDDDESI